MNIEEIKNNRRIKSNLFAVIPASVRYDPNLTFSAKFLYLEITAALDIEGVCEANNAYFASILHVSEQTITRYLKQLEERKYIQREYRKGRRIIQLPSQIITFIAPPSLRKETPKLDEETVKFMNEFLDKFEELSNTRLSAKKFYYKTILERLDSFSKEEIMEALLNRFDFINSSEWYQEPKNKFHIKNINLLIRDDETLLNWLNKKRDDKTSSTGQNEDNSGKLVKFKVEQDKKTLLE